MRFVARPLGGALLALALCARAAHANWPDNGLPVFDGSTYHFLSTTVALPAPEVVAFVGYPEAFVVADGNVVLPGWGLVDESGAIASGGLTGSLGGSIPAAAATGYGPLSPAQARAAGAVMVWRRQLADLSAQFRIGRPLTGTWPTVWPDTGYAVNTQAADLWSRAVTGAADGGALVAWADMSTGTQVLHVQRFAEDGSTLWPANGVAVTGTLSPGYGALDLWMVPDAGTPDRPTGTGAWLAWARRDSNATPMLLRVVHVQSDGSLAAGTPLGGLVIGSAPAATVAGLATDGAGGVYVAATEATQILGWRLLANASLAPGWLADGVSVNVPAPRVGNVTVANLATELDVAWSDTLDAATRWNVRAQRILPDGTRPAGWGAAGVQVTSGAGLELASAITADLRVGWLDSSGRPYALALRADGTPDPLWPAGGTRLSDLQGYAPLLVDDGHGGVLATWQVSDTGITANVYAQVVSASGRADTPPASPPIALRLGAPRPNPAAGGVRLSLELPHAAHVVADVFDVAGRREAALFSGDVGAGTREIAWDGRDARGLPAAAGLHFVRVRVDGTELSQTVVRVR